MAQSFLYISFQHFIPKGVLRVYDVKYVYLEQEAQNPMESIK